MAILSQIGNALTTGASSGIQGASSRGFGLRGLISGAINNMFAKKAEKRQFEYNKKLMAYQNDLNKSNEFSSAGRQMAGLKAAGVNPSLADGSAPATVSGSSVSQGSGQADVGSSEALVSQQGASLNKDLEVKDSQVKANLAIAREHEANAEGKEIENDNAEQRWKDKDAILGFQRGNAAIDNEYFEQNIVAKLRQTGALADDAAASASLKRIDEQTRAQFNEETIRNIQENTNLTARQAELAVTAAKLNGFLMDYYGQETRARRYINDMNDYFNSHGWDANPIANQEFKKLEQLVLSIENAAKSGNYTDAMTAGQEFANEVAPADKAFQWGNMIIQGLMTGVMMYSMYKGSGANPMSGVGAGSVQVGKTAWQTKQIDLLQKAARSKNITRDMVWTSEMKNVAFQAARERGWTYNAKARKWVKYDAKAKRWLQTDEHNLLSNYMTHLGF